jgi:hypothetical protein
MARIRKIDRIVNEETVVETSVEGPTAQQLLDALNRVPNKDVPIEVFLEVSEDGINLGVLISTMGINPTTGGASMIVVPDLRDDPEQDDNDWGTPEELAGDPHHGIFPKRQD